MKLIAAILTLSAMFSQNAKAQDDESRIKATINQFFDGMRTSDTAMMRRSFLPGAGLSTIVKSKDGETVVKSESLENFLAIVGRPHEEIYDERIEFEVIRTDGDLAMAWTPYRFYAGKQFSHCGVNLFQLVRSASGWKIMSIIDTRRKKDCKEM